MSAPMRPELLPILTRVLDIQRELDIRKKLYAELDALLLTLAEEGFESTELDGLVLSLRDNFAPGCNTGWTSAAVRRYDLTAETREKVEKRKMKGVK